MSDLQTYRTVLQFMKLGVVPVCVLEGTLKRPISNWTHTIKLEMSTPNLLVKLNVEQVRQSQLYSYVKRFGIFTQNYPTLFKIHSCSSRKMGKPKFHKET